MNSSYARWGKRVFDLAVVIPALIILAPLMLVIALFVRVKLGTPVLFRQERPGRNEKLFLLTKFRSMTDARDASGTLLSDSERLTRFGATLRSTSLDELPELLNVLKGEMSLVGPRPLLTRYTPYFEDEERIRFRARPGITGLAQVNGRNDLNWDARIGHDVEYVKTMSLRLDVVILVRTVLAVFRRSGLQVDPGAVRLDFDAERMLREKQGSEPVELA